MTKEEVWRLLAKALAAKQEWFTAWEKYCVASKELHDAESEERKDKVAP